MKSKNKKYAKPYPKSYIILAVAFSIVLCGIWGFYGYLFGLDTKTTTRYELATTASAIASDIEKKDFDGANEKLKTITEGLKSLEVTSAEKSCLDELSNSIETIANDEDVQAMRSTAYSAIYLSEELRLNADIAKKESRTAHITGDFIMMGIFLAVVITLLFIGRFVQKRESEKETLARANEKIKKKTVEVAYKNVLFDCGNRYALEEYISKQLVKQNTFCLTQLTLGDYSNLLSIMGFDKMDNCLSKIASKVKEKFEKFGTLFMIKDEDFVFVFNNEIPTTDASNIAESIRRTIYEIIFTEIHISVPIIGAVLNTKRYSNTSSDKILTSLHSASAQSVFTAPLPVV